MPERQLQISDYAVIGDCHSAALVARTGSIDWCCLPRFDSASCFGRLVDPEAGQWTLAPTAEHGCERRYLEGTLLLETTFRTSTGVATVTDCFAMHEGGRSSPYRQIIRLVEGVEGEVELTSALSARLDYGSVRPWIRDHGPGSWTVVGGDQGLEVCGDVPFERDGDHDLVAGFRVAAGERRRAVLTFVRPEQVDAGPRAALEPTEIDERLDDTVSWWRRWSERADLESTVDRDEVLRSAIVLKAMTYAPTGAIVAAVTTSLPESTEGDRNWDYRYSWVRDSVWSVRALVRLGYGDVADGFRRFIERSAAGSPDQLQIMYGLGGERRLVEWELPGLAGFNGHGPVRIGNAAHTQVQHDLYGDLLDLAWRWHELGHEPDDDYWRFITETADAAAERWPEADRGIWEWRGDPQHFVNSKAMCWVALDHAIALGERLGRTSHLDRWTGVRDEIREDVMANGVDRERGCYVQAYGSTAVDAALLRLPLMGFTDFDDPLVAGTVDAVLEDLTRGPYVWRYWTEDGLVGREGAFLPCSFWLVECLAGLGRQEEAERIFEGTVAAANDVGLFAEEYDVSADCPLGNVPQALTHLSHIAAARALARPESASEENEPA